MFQDSIRHSVTFDVAFDPAADDVYPLWRAPLAGELKSAYATVANTVSGSTANYFSVILRNGGAAGTATTALGTAGGTGGWVGLTPKTMSVPSETNFAAGDVLTLSYDETGTGTFGQVTVQLDYVFGT